MLGIPRDTHKLSDLTAHTFLRRELDNSYYINIIVYTACCSSCKLHCIDSNGSVFLSKWHTSSYTSLSLFVCHAMMFSCLHGQAPQYLVKLCQSVSDVPSLQHFSICQLMTPGHTMVPGTSSAIEPSGSLCPDHWFRIRCLSLNLSSSEFQTMRDPAVQRDSFSHIIKTFSFNKWTSVQKVNLYSALS